ncbi:MAG: hypothetical protein OEW19_12960 [Acidobacteriota bacterium]|nr:hypothetical protein [Acidobacteriota bacterium]
MSCTSSSPVGCPDTALDRHPVAQLPRRVGAALQERLSKGTVDLPERFHLSGAHTHARHLRDSDVGGGLVAIP